jgi:hypothetical protein
MEKATRDQADVDLLGHSTVNEMYSSQKRQAFDGSSNPRHLRSLHGLLKGALTRQALDRIAGCSNAPELVAELRRRGLMVPCTRVPAFDRDGKPIRYGVYHLNDQDRKLIYRWLASSSKGAL